MMKQWMKCVVLMLGSLLAAPVWAGDAALYGAIAPANAGFFRVMNASGTPLSVDFNGKTTNLTASQCSPYAFAVEGDYTVTLNGQSQPLKLVQGTQQTLLWQDGKVKVISETPFKDKSRARLAFYNLMDSQQSLLTKQGKSILGPVESGASALRDVNAVRATFGVGEESKILATTPAMILKRGQVTSLFVLNVSGQPHIAVVESVQ